MTRYTTLAVAGLRLLGALLLSSPAFAAAASSAPAAAATKAQELPREEAPFTPALAYADQVLTRDTVWRGDVLVTGSLTVAPQATLTVEPGTVVRFKRQGAQGALLVVQGRIIAAGNAERPILFTSGFTTAAAGDWQGVMLLGTEKKNLLEQCRIEGAQTGLDAMFSSVTLKNVRSERSVVGMRFQDTLLTMDGGGASDCDTGISLIESEATLRSIALVGNRLGLSAKKSSVYLYDGNLSGNKASAFTGDSCRIKIQGGAALGNGTGVTLLASEGGVTGAKIGKNREYGLSLTASRIRVSGNQISGNGENGIIVFDGKSVAWDNAVYENAGYDLYNAGNEEFRAPGNWWGNAAPKIYDNGGRAPVLYAPVLPERPTPLLGQ